MLQVTDTAVAIARVRAEESRLPAAERLFDDPFAPLFAGGDAVAEILERMLVIPFFREAIRLRTRFIDDVVRAALDDGLRQIVILGAGFDCRALRLPEIARAAARVFEVDFGPQLEAKRAVLARAGIATPSLARPVACDFAASDGEVRLTADLTAAGYEPGRGTVFVWEGVVGYLDDRDVDRTLAWMPRVGGHGVRLVFNYGINRFDPDRLAPRLRAAGFARHEDRPLGALWGRYLPGTPPVGGDLYRVAVAHV